MKFGLFFELSVTAPSTPEAEQRVFQQAIEQAVLAEELGFDQVWCVEHYFLEGYSNSSSPETFLAYLAALTTTIRLGHGIRVLLPEVTHPVRAGMQAAFLDVMSGGRLEFGTGRQSTWTEMGAFGVQPDETKDAWEELVRLFPRMWQDDEFSFQGKYLNFPPRAVRPHPLQRPHPPMWVAVMSPPTARTAGERGLGFLGTSLGAPSKYAGMIAEYREAIAGCTDPVGDFINEQVNGVGYMYCGETDAHSDREGLPAAQTYFASGGGVLGIGSIYPSPNYRPASSASGAGPTHRPGQTMGSPERCVEVLKEWEAVGIDRMCFLTNFDQITPHELVLDSLRRFAAKVMPVFSDAPPTLSASDLAQVGAAVNGGL